MRWVWDLMRIMITTSLRTSRTRCSLRIRAAFPNISVTAQLQVILVKPEKFSDTKEIANHLCNKKTVVLNLEATTPDVTRRIIDFLGGVAYANGGSIKPVANNTFIITPYNVGFQGDELSAELESNGVLL